VNLADVAPTPSYALGAVACTGLVCLLIVSGVVLAIVLYRRRGRGAPPTP
jgi:uncharacterized membrane protein (DUF4010 family)